MSELEEDQYFPDDPPLFRIGQLVRHRRYGYRGVVVDFDVRCLASDEWYDSNQTRPERDQPWYHVFVDDSEAITYTAQTSLVTDDSDLPVDHRLMDVFFEGFQDGVYLRNDRPWPEDRG